MRVPNERDDASTTKVEVQFPDGFQSASYEPVPGWTRQGHHGQARATPIQTDDGQVTEGVKHDHLDRGRATTTRSRPAPSWTSASRSGSPTRPARSSTFKALQTYSGGEVVRWIGAEGSDNPAPIVTVTEAAADEHGAADHQPRRPPRFAAERTSATTEDDGGNGLAIIALIVGALGLAVGVAGFVRASGRSA